MAKKKSEAESEPLKEPEFPNIEQKELADLMFQFDEHGIQIEETQWRPLSDAEKTSAVEWLRKRRIEEKSILPQCLRRFATREITEESDAMISRRREGRKVMMSCIFRKPGFDKSEDGAEMIKVGFKVSDTHLTGTTAQELFGRTRVALEFTRRPMQEIDSRELIEGNRPVFSVQTEIHSFGWNGGNWSFSALVPAETYPLEESIADWKGQGTVRIEVLDKLDPSIEEPEQPKRGRGRPPKAKPAESNGETLFKPEKKTEPAPEQMSLDIQVGIALTDKCRLRLRVKQLEDMRWESTWSGENLAGGCSEQEPSVRVSQSEAAISSLGRAIEFFSTSEDAESQQVVKDARRWLNSLSAGQCLEDIAKVEE